MIKIATVITNYNKAEFIADAIQSAIAQGDPVIVVDDASTDGSRDLIRNFENIDVHCLDVNVGATMATVIGVEAAIKQGAEFVTLLDGDDVLCQNANAYYRELLNKYPCGGIYSSVCRRRKSDAREDAVPCDLKAEILIILRPLKRWLTRGKGTTAVCARPKYMLANIVRDLRYQDHQIAYSIHKNSDCVIYSDAVTHYCSIAESSNLSQLWHLRHTSLMRFYCSIYPEISTLPETRILAKKIRRYVWKTALYRSMKLDFRFLTQLLRVLFTRNPTPEFVEQEARIGLRWLGHL